MNVEVSLIISLKRSSLHCAIVKRNLDYSRRKTNLGGVHLVDSDDELPDTESEGEESVLASLTILGDTSLELTSTTGDDEDSTISLGGSSDHVFDEVTMTGGIDNLSRRLD